MKGRWKPYSQVRPGIKEVQVIGFHSQGEEKKNNNKGGMEEKPKNQVSKFSCLSQNPSESSFPLQQLDSDLL